MFFIEFLSVTEVCFINYLAFNCSQFKLEHYLVMAFLILLKPGSRLVMEHFFEKNSALGCNGCPEKLG